MEEYKTRLMIEFKELTTKIDKLKEFMTTIKFESLDMVSAILMKNQLSFMIGYQQCLYDRINLTITIKEMEEFDKNEKE